MNFVEAKKYILNRLKHDLPKNLTYHGYHHTLDVYEMCIDIAKHEGIDNHEELTLLKTAALFHDCGFLRAYKGHEDASCEIAKESLSNFNYTQEQIQVVCGLIQATKIPQKPQTKLEEILADADLDYLGRDDFYPVAKTLYEELKSIHAIHDENEWNKIQVSFIGAHEYFTDTCLQRRKSERDKRLAELKMIIK
jgi:HD superfamily phosphohydrolase YqeK